MYLLTTLDHMLQDLYADVRQIYHWTRDKYRCLGSVSGSHLDYDDLLQVRKRQA
jgi:hypothetical protein